MRHSGDQSSQKWANINGICISALTSPSNEGGNDAHKGKRCVFMAEVTIASPLPRMMPMRLKPTRGKPEHGQGGVASSVGMSASGEGYLAGDGLS